MRKSVAVLAVALLAVPAMGADYYAAGSFNSWTSNGDLMTEVTPDVYYTVTINSSGDQDFKITDGTWDNPYPAENVGIHFGGAANDIELRFLPGSFSDPWYPKTNRVGYEWLGLHGWEVMGSFNDWASPVLTLTDQGSGLFTGELVVPTPGTYEFKYRMTDNWETAVGDLAGINPSNDNISITTTVPNEVLQLGIDMPNGRYRIPEPASLSLLALGGLAILRRR